MAVQKQGSPQCNIGVGPPWNQERIKKCIDERIAATKRKMFFKAFYAISMFFGTYGDNPIGLIFSRTLADITTPSSFRTLMPGENQLVGVPEEQMLQCRKADALVAVIRVDIW